MKLKDFLDVVTEPVQVVVQEKGKCAKYVMLSTNYDIAKEYDRTIWHVSPVSTTEQARMRVTVA
ncbi:MAG: hypothetical protein LBS45_12220 [Synergistaceae bacterium]|jgi:hypothetical protein|nr:hypothetical protein [Synergistaceae bacterium]